MNIFLLDKDPALSAKYHCDKHVVKMIVKYAQLLSTALHELGYGNDKIYKSTHKNHPSAKWVREDWINFDYLSMLLLFLLNEYTVRYNKSHKTKIVFTEINRIRLNITKPIHIYPESSVDFSKFPLAMPDEFKVSDPVESYRNYYRIAKKDICKWKTEIPFWFNKN